MEKIEHEQAPEKCHKCKSCLKNILRLIGALLFVYIFVLSIGLLSDSFQGTNR